MSNRVIKFRGRRLRNVERAVCRCEGTNRSFQVARDMFRSAKGHKRRTLWCWTTLPSGVTEVTMNLQREVPECTWKRVQHMRSEVCDNWISLSVHYVIIAPVTEPLELKDIARPVLNLCICEICHLAISIYFGEAGIKKVEYSQKASILRSLLRNDFICNYTKWKKNGTPNSPVCGMLKTRRSCKKICIMHFHLKHETPKKFPIILSIAHTKYLYLHHTMLIISI